MDEELAEERIVGKNEGEGKKKDSRRLRFYRFLLNYL